MKYIKKWMRRIKQRITISKFKIQVIKTKMIKFKSLKKMKKILIFKPKTLNKYI